MKKQLITLVTGSSLAITAVALSMTKDSEGKRNRAYLDPVGIPTICYGHTGPEVRVGMVWSDAKCEQVLLTDITKHRQGVSRCIRRPLNQNQWDAVTDMAFNIGDAKVCGSTLVRKINAGDLKGAAAEFPKWKFANAGGHMVVLPGLVTRRAKERALFETPWDPRGYQVVTRYSYLTD